VIFQIRISRSLAQVNANENDTIFATAYLFRLKYFLLVLGLDDGTVVVRWAGHGWPFQLGVSWTETGRRGGMNARNQYGTAPLVSRILIAVGPVGGLNA